MILLILFTFASYHEGSGSTTWLQWLTAVSILAFVFIFDVSFTDESSFLFDPDADNWRRKVVRFVMEGGGGVFVNKSLFLLFLLFIVT
jgi:hypothetical protein